MNKYPKKTQNVISHYVKTLPSNVIPKFPQLFVEFIKYYLNEQTEEGIANNNDNNILGTSENIKSSVYKSNVSIPMSRTKSIQSTFNNSIPSSYSETSSYYYNNHKRSLPGNLCLITKSAEFNEVQITLRELFLDLYNDDLLSQYFYPIFVDFSHENIFALWLKEDDENNYSSQGSPYWGINGFQTGRTGTKHTSLMGTGSNILNRPVSVGSLPIVKIGLEKQRIAVIAKNLNSFLSLLTQNSFVSNIVRNYRIGGGDESTVLSSEGSSDEEYNSIQEMMRFDGDLFENGMTSDSSNLSLEDGQYKLSEDSNELISSPLLEDEEEEDDNTNDDENEFEFEDEKETVRNEESQENTDEQFTLEIESNEGDDEREDSEKESDGEDEDEDIEEQKSIKKKGHKSLKGNDEFIYVLSGNENEDEKVKNSSSDNKEEEEIDSLGSDNETLSSSITDRRHPNNNFGYDSEIRLKSHNDSIDVLGNDNSLPNSFPYHRRYFDDYERMNKSEMNFRHYSYASSINSTLTAVSASPFAIRTMYQQKETQKAYIQWYDEICKKENINLDNSDEIEKKLLNGGSVLRSSSVSSVRSNNRKYLSMDGYQLNKTSYDSLKRNRSLSSSSHGPTKHNQRPVSLWDSILGKNRPVGFDKSSSILTNSPDEKVNDSIININNNDNTNNENSNNSNNNNNNVNNNSNGNSNSNSKDNENSKETTDKNAGLHPVNVVSANNNKNRKHKSSKKSNSKLSVKSISHTLTKSASKAPKQIKRKLKGNTSLQKLKLKDNSHQNSKSKNKESSSSHHYSNQKTTSLYSKKMIYKNEMLPPPSSALSKNISSYSRTKVSSPLSQRNHPDNYLNPRKNVPTTVTTMMTISNNLSHTSPKIPSKLHQNVIINRYRTNSSPAQIYSNKSNNRTMNTLRQNINNNNNNNNQRVSPTTTTTNPSIIITNSSSNIKSSSIISDNKENISSNKNTIATEVNTNIVKGDKQQKGPLQINTSLPKKESNDTITTPKTAPLFFSSENNFLNNLFGTKKFTKFNGLNFLTNIPIVAKLLNLDKESDDNNNTSNKENTNSNSDHVNSSMENQNNKNNLPIDISQQGVNTHSNFEKSPAKSTFSTYTNNSGTTINYVTSSTLAQQILEKERKGIPEPEQWLQKQVKAKAYAIAVANAVAKRNTQKNNNNHNIHDYTPYTTKFIPTNHLPITSKHSKTSVETSKTTTTNALNNNKERKAFVEEDDYFML